MKVKKTLLTVILAVVLIAALVLTACGPAEPVEQTPVVTGVSVTPASATVTAGATLPLSATVTGTGNISQAVTWSSSDNAVATVSISGIVVAHTQGNAVITATAVGTTISGTANIIVSQAHTGGTPPGNGNNNNNGNGNGPEPGNGDFIAISAGGNHSLAIDADGNLWAWGENFIGQLGDGTTEDRFTPVRIMSGTVFQKISAGYHHNLAICVQGNLWAWGDNTHGQLGNGDFGWDNYSSKPIRIMPETTFLQISAGERHSLSIDSHGNLWAWGSNLSGQIGDGTYDWSLPRPIPTHIMQGFAFSLISAGFGHNLALDLEGQLWAWGRNFQGQIGDGTTDDRLTPVPIKPDTTIKQISAGSDHSLAIDSSGNLWAWGRNFEGQLGNGTTYARHLPVHIMQGTAFTSISASWSHNLAIDVHGNIWAWGRNDEGQIGDGTYGWENTRLLPVSVKYGTEFIHIGAGVSHSLAVDTDGYLWAWGGNWIGQLGDGTQECRHTPVRIVLVSS